MIRLGFIGAGGYGRMQLDGFLALQTEGLVKITALADPSVSVLDGLNALPELKMASRFSDYRDLLAFEELDAVVINAPIPLHEEMTLAALNRGLFILLEKPPVPLLSQLDRLIAADPNGRVMVAFQHIYSDLVRDLKRRLVDRQIGRLLSISARGLWPRDAPYYQRSAWAGQLTWNGHAVLDGPCTNGFAHYVNLVLYLASGGSDSFAQPVQLRGEAYRARPGLPTYDTGCLTGSLEDDVRFFIGFSHASDVLSLVEIEIQGTEGKLRLLENGEAVQTEDGQIIQGNDGRDNLRRAFLAFAGGDASQNKTSLSDTRAYVLATNLMLASAGGIQQIPGEHVRCVDTDMGKGIFAVEHLGDFFAQGVSQIVPLSQTSAPWAQETRSLSAAGFVEGDLISVLQSVEIANRAGA